MDRKHGRWVQGRWMLGLSVCALVGWGFLTSSGAGQVVQGPAPLGNQAVQMQSTMLASGVQQVVILDPAARTMAVYHIDAALGKIQLRSVRSLAWDLRMEEFNAQTPLPSELRQIQPNN